MFLYCKKRQSNNFIINIDNTDLKIEAIEQQIKKIYYSNRTKFVDELVLLSHKIVLRAYKRK